MIPDAAELNLTSESNPLGVANDLYLRHVLAEPFTITLADLWPTSAEGLGALEPEAAFFTRESDGDERVFMRRELSAALVMLQGGRAIAFSSGTTRGDAEALLADLRAALPRMDSDPDAPRVAVTFWSLGAHGPQAVSRMIDVPAWVAITPNYRDDVAAVLTHTLGGGFAPGVGGQLLLWHGEPGTGKTWALRALASEWRHWCDLHYITDPEEFFGGHAAYMLQVLLADGGTELATPGERPAKPADRRADGGRWRLLVLEDTGEMLTTDAKERTGQGLSRLLNVVDGLIGQGLRVLILVTTNEKVRALHPAVARAGRCALRLEFEPLQFDEAKAWLEHHGADPALAGRRSSWPVSDLYAEIAGRREPERERSVGFGS